MGSMDQAGDGTIATLTAEECWELVNAATIGRLGFISDDTVQIIPVNYAVDGDVIIRTRSAGILSELAGGPSVAFQVDYHSSGGAGWSVLMSGKLTAMSDDELENVHLSSRVLPWAGGDRDLHLRFKPEHISGRRVRRTRNR